MYTTHLSTHMKAPRIGILGKSKTRPQKKIPAKKSGSCMLFCLFVCLFLFATTVVMLLIFKPWVFKAATTIPKVKLEEVSGCRRFVAQGLEHWLLSIVMVQFWVKTALFDIPLSTWAFDKKLDFHTPRCMLIHTELDELEFFFVGCDILRKHNSYTCTID